MVVATEIHNDFRMFVHFFSVFVSWIIPQLTVSQVLFTKENLILFVVFPFPLSSFLSFFFLYHQI